MRLFWSLHEQKRSWDPELDPELVPPRTESSPPGISRHPPLTSLPTPLHGNPQWPFGRGFMSQYKTRRSGGLRENLLWTCCDLSAPPVLICCLLPGPSPSSSSSTGTSTMDSSGMLRGLLFVGLLFVMCHGQASQEVSVEEFGDENPEAATDKDLIEALEALLGKVHKPSSSTAEKRGSIPMCGIGELCVMKYGSRFGKLCDCSGGTTCNSYLLKCI